MATAQKPKVIANTGGKTPVSGQYKPVGSKTEITMTQGNKVPPGPNGATTFVLVDPTKHQTPKKNG